MRKKNPHHELRLKKIRRLRKLGRGSNATDPSHIHHHHPTWLPPTRVALTHAWYRRHKQVPPTRRKVNDG